MRVIGVSQQEAKTFSFPSFREDVFSGNLVNRGNQPLIVVSRLGFSQVPKGYLHNCIKWNKKQRGPEAGASNQGGVHGSQRRTRRQKRIR